MVVGDVEHAKSMWSSDIGWKDGLSVSREFDPASHCKNALKIIIHRRFWIRRRLIVVRSNVLPTLMKLVRAMRSTMVWIFVFAITPIWILPKIVNSAKNTGTRRSAKQATVFILLWCRNRRRSRMRKQILHDQTLHIKRYISIQGTYCSNAGVCTEDGFVNVKMGIQVYCENDCGASTVSMFGTRWTNSTIWIYGTIQKPSKHVVNVNPKIHMPTKPTNGTPNEALYLITIKNNITVKMLPLSSI